MLNKERKFPKREPVWKPLFDIFCYLSFSYEKNYVPGKDGTRGTSLEPTLPVQEKSS